VREILHKHSRFFLLAALGGLALRALFLLRFPAVTADSLLYGAIAKNWLLHGVYGQAELDQIVPTDIRLPGYPAFLAAAFRVFGMEHYRAALVIQAFVDLLTCFVTADLARRLFSERAAKAAFVLAAFCPFLANYAAAALTETLEIFFTALALDFAVAGLNGLNRFSSPGAGGDINYTRGSPWWGCGLSIGACMLLRPDGGLLLAAVLAWLFWLLVRRLRERGLAVPMIKAGFIVVIASLGLLVPWTLRNLLTLHQFQPLAPRYANEPGTYVPEGFNRWVKTWMADYVSNEEVYWMVPGSVIDADNLPSRAFDSPEQQDETEQLLDDYNHLLQVDPAIDARFAALASQRIHAAPLRYYVWLPALRIAGMWLRPRTELLPCNSRWWEFDDYRKWLLLTVGLGALNLLYIGAACLGLVRARRAPPLGLLVIFVLFRTAFLGTLENPEPRYTLECYPVVIVLASALFWGYDRIRNGHPPRS
jgi:4-amino-4-deoxy-L-arabinose transferase-like glycosyltransferase